MNVNSHTDYLCTFVGDRPSKIRIIHQTSDRISVLFLEAKGSWYTGDYNWFYTDEFFKHRKLTSIPTEQQTPKEIIDVLFLEGSKNFREQYFKYLKNKNLCGNTR